MTDRHVGRASWEMVTTPLQESFLRKARQTCSFSAHCACVTPSQVGEPCIRLCQPPSSMLQLISSCHCSVTVLSFIHPSIRLNFWCILKQTHSCSSLPESKLCPQISQTQNEEISLFPDYSKLSYLYKNYFQIVVQNICFQQVKHLFIPSPLFIIFLRRNHHPQLLSPLSLFDTSHAPVLNFAHATFSTYRLVAVCFRPCL